LLDVRNLNVDLQYAAPQPEITPAS
jgi:hypothetical protein